MLSILNDISSTEYIAIIIQCLLTGVAGYTSIFQLRKEQRKRGIIDRKEARIVRWLIIIFSISSIALQLFTFLNSANDSKKSDDKYSALIDSYKILKRGNRELLNRNKDLERAIINEVDKSTAEVVYNASQNAIEASKKLETTALSLNKLIVGTDTVPEVMIELGSHLSIVYTNTSSLPIINADLKLMNYDSLQNCRLDYYSKAYHIKKECLNKYTLEYSISLLPYSHFILSFPLLTDNQALAKLAIYFHVRNKFYIQQISFIKTNSRVRIYKVRTLFSNDGVTYKAINEYGTPDMKIDWNTSFPLPNTFSFSND